MHKITVAAAATAMALVEKARSDFAELHDAVAGTPAEALVTRLHARLNRLVRIVDADAPGFDLVARSGGHDKPDDPPTVP